MLKPEQPALVSVQSLAQDLRNGVPIALIDCRFDLTAPRAGRAAFASTHLPRAIYLDLEQDLSGPVTSRTGRHPLPALSVLAAKLSRSGIGPITRVVAYDEANGSFAARAWWLLRSLNFRHVAVLDGGFSAWVAGGAPVSGVAHGPITSSSPDVTFEAGGNAGGVASAHEVLEAARDPSWIVVDARAPDRFSGKTEPLDAIAGHVPGAINHPFMENLAPDGRFLEPAELHRRWEALLDGRSPERSIMMCGSGVTACHNLLAMEVAGLRGARLYAGSWSEWIRDAARPVARGPTSR